MEAINQNTQELCILAFHMKTLDFKNETNYCKYIILSDDYITTIRPDLKTIIATNNGKDNVNDNWINVDKEQSFKLSIGSNIFLYNQNSKKHTLKAFVASSNIDRDII